jgi:hypothetical protein
MKVNDHKIDKSQSNKRGHHGNRCLIRGNTGMTMYFSNLALRQLPSLGNASYL